MVHIQLRKALEVAREAIEDADPNGASPPSRELLLFCRGFCVALTGHHAGEDKLLFPEIARARPDLGPVLRELSRDHSMLDHLIGGLEKALDAGAPPEETLQHLDGIEAVMETHFRYEEKKLLSVLGGLGIDASRGSVLGPLA